MNGISGHGPPKDAGAQRGTQAATRNTDVIDRVECLRRMAGHCRKIAEICADLAATEEIQLAAPRDPGVMDAVPERPRLMTAADLAEMLCVDAKTIRRWRTEGHLPVAIEIGSIVRWRAEDVVAWIEEQRG